MQHPDKKALFNNRTSKTSDSIHPSQLVEKSPQFNSVQINNNNENPGFNLQSSPSLKRDSSSFS